MAGETPMADTPTLYGVAYSVYSRIACLALGEKGVPHDFVETDVFAPGGPTAEHMARHPFGRIPVLQVGDFQLYETCAITRYVDEAFPGPALQPDDVQARARMAQAISILDAYAYRTLVWDVFVERVRAPVEGRAPDEDKITASLPLARTCLDALNSIMGNQPWLCGPEISLGDLHAFPMLLYFRMAREGEELLAEHPALLRWLQTMAERSTVRATRSPLETP